MDAGARLTVVSAYTAFDSGALAHAPSPSVADGHVTELGTHDELLAARGRYAELFELQAAGYR